MSEDVVEEWCERHGLTWRDDGYIVDRHDQKHAHFAHDQNGPIRFDNGLTGEPLGIEDQRWLIIEGQRLGDEGIFRVDGQTMRSLRTEDSWSM